MGFLRECQRRYGDVFTIGLPGARRTVLMNPHDWPEYFKNQTLEFEAVGHEMASRAFAYTLEDVERCDYPRLRGQLNTFLRGDPLQKMTERMQMKLEGRLLRAASHDWQEDSLYRWANEHVFAAGTDALFGDGTYSEHVRRAHKVLGVPAWLLPGARRAQRELAASLERGRPGAAQLIEERDLAFDEEDLRPSVRGHFNASLFWAAQTNTIPAAFWTLLFVLRDPRARVELLDEVRRFAGQTPPEQPGAKLFSRADLKAMVKLDSAIQEVNRLTTAAMVPRRALEDLVLPLQNGRRLRVREGEDLMLLSPTTHLDPEIFDSPEEFRFDRFVTEDGRPKHWYKNGRRLHFPLVPFGAGKSMCPGRYFVINEFKVTVATLLAWFDVELLCDGTPAFDLSRTGFGTYPPRADVPFRYRLRS